MIPSNCFIPCDTFKLLYAMWYIQTVVYHVIHVKKKLLVIIILLWGYSQSQFLSLSETTITVPRYFAMWCIQTVSYHVLSSNLSYHVIPSTNFFYTMWYFQSVLYHVMHSNCLIPCATFNLFYIMWYLQTVHTIWYIQSLLCHVIPSTCFIPFDVTIPLNVLIRLAVRVLLFYSQTY